MYDIIGDVHGHGEYLEGLLKKLGYEKQNGTYRHPDRKAIFVGDIINRGPEIKKCLRIVRNMVEHEYGYMVNGNHECNLLIYRYASKNNLSIPDHLSFNLKTLNTTLSEFEGDKASLKSYCKWLKTLPIYLEFDKIRIVHAMWYNSAVNSLHRFFPTPRFDNAFMHIIFNNIQRWNEVSYLFRGIEIPFPNALASDWGKVYRMKWWQNAFGKSYEVWSSRTGQYLPDKRVPVEKSLRYPGYSPAEKPVFFGHYCLTDTPQLQAPNVCCLDFCVLKSGHLTAYRWVGEEELSNYQFIVYPDL